jgi:hypothetical protein
MKLQQAIMGALKRHIGNTLRNIRLDMTQNNKNGKKDSLTIYMVVDYQCLTINYLSLKIK